MTHLSPRKAGDLEPLGIYILANDLVFDFFRTAYHSVKHYSAGTPVVVIPYDENCGRIDSFLNIDDQLFENCELLKRCDLLGKKFLPSEGHAWRMFRKLAAFHGPFENFLYIDADIAMLSNPCSLGRLFRDSDLDLLGFDVNHDQVYRPGAYRIQRQEKYHSVAVTAGVWVSRKGALTIDLAESILPSAIKNHREFVLGVFDQGFFNYLIEESGVKAKAIFDLDPSYPVKTWSDWGRLIENDSGQWIRHHPDHSDHGKAVPLVHWAGHSQHELFPNRHIFRKFINYREPSWLRLIYLVYDPVRAICKRVLKTLWKTWRFIRRKLISFQVNYLCRLTNWLSVSGKNSSE